MAKRKVSSSCSAQTRTHRPPVVLIVIDGWGMTEKRLDSNAIARAHTPNFDHYWEHYPHALLQASGAAVGLPETQVGNSEAGHQTIGAGRVLQQEALRIESKIRDRSFFKNPSFLRAIDHVKREHSHLHLMGLLTDNQSAHAYPSHLFALFRLVEAAELKQTFLHLFTDGRDSGLQESMKFLGEVKKRLPSGMRIATLMGRYYGMERSKRWKITQQAYNTLVLGTGLRAKTGEAAILNAYDRGETDEFIRPTLIGERESDFDESRIDHRDAVIFFNLRSDRARQLSKVFVQQAFHRSNPHSFSRKKKLHHLVFVALTDFGPDLDHILTAYPSEPLTHTLPMMLSQYRQCYIAESEKYAHMTYFLNGGHQQPIANEDRLVIASPDVQNYAKAPEMSAEKMTSELLRRLRGNEFDFFGINYANPDMVAHTGNFHAGVKACEVTDEQIGRIVSEVHKKHGTVFLTSDHGNAEEMMNLKTGRIDSEHNANPVPFIILPSSKRRFPMKPEGGLADIAPTILTMMGIRPPALMSKHVLCRERI